MSTKQQNTKKRSQGLGAKKRQETKYRNKKNQSYADTLRESIMLRLNVPDPTTLSGLKVESAVRPAVIPVSFQALPQFLDEVWELMLSKAPRPFAEMARDEATKAIFIRTSLMIAEAKVAFAQRQATALPHETSSKHRFTEDQLESLRSTSSRLPRPLAVALQSIGNFVQDDQRVTPVLPPPATNIRQMVYSATEIASVVSRYGDNAAGVPLNIVAMAQRYSLPLYQWRNIDELEPGTIQLWGNADPLPPAHRKTYLKIIASMEVKQGFLVATDIGKGDGTAAQAVRFPTYTHDSTSLPYYSNVRISEMDEFVATAIPFGIDPPERFSRYCGFIDHPLLRGYSNLLRTRRALIWSAN